MGIIAGQATANTVLSYIGLGFVNTMLLHPRILQADGSGRTHDIVAFMEQRMTAAGSGS
ncbi:MAG TPA: hypothetical protein VKG92_11360 [Flavobacteriales bacterium]|nr:hypothetical protein [Flavobacteriales bacterium]